MGYYILRRLFLLIPTLFGIILVNFLVIQVAPGGPIEQILINLRGQVTDVESRLGGASDSNLNPMDNQIPLYQGAQGIDPALIKELEAQFGFDRPPGERFLKMIKNFVTFDLGRSYFRDEDVMTLLKSKLPVSISIGLWTTLLVYLISIPLGIAKASRDGSSFDIWTSALIIVGYAVPGFMFALFLIILFAGGSFWNIFPLRGLFSENWATLSLGGKIMDYFWHLTLPLTAVVVGGFAKLTLLTKNSFIEEINRQYVITARAKGLGPNRVLYGHVFRNAMLIVIAGFPAAFIHILFTASLLIEVLFSLDGIGLLGFEAATSRDYPVMFGTLYIYTLFGLLLHLINDICYMLVDRRIDLAVGKR